LSTAVGAALADPDRRHILIIGDQSFLYDHNGLYGQKFLRIWWYVYSIMG